jgi:hypothetical protein
MASLFCVHMLWRSSLPLECRLLQFISKNEKLENLRYASAILKCGSENKQPTKVTADISNLPFETFPQ